jgi:hypothetical protein
VDCIHLAENRDQWWTVVNTIINLLGLKCEGSLISCEANSSSRLILSQYIVDMIGMDLTDIGLGCGLDSTGSG